MDTNRLPGLTLGSFLRDRRSRLRPETSTPRRRTPGLRREEVAARAGVSVTWYTWLEQGRGGPPSDEVLERLARALELDAVAREFMFLLAQQRPPPAQVEAPAQVAPSLQRVLDALPSSPAYVKTRAWDIVAWNDAATAVLSDYGQLPPRERNVLRRMFGDPALRAKLPDWEQNARLVLEIFRMELARGGNDAEATALVSELEVVSPDFRRLWADHAVRTHATLQKRLLHPTGGELTLEYSAFAVDGEEGLSLVVCTPATEADAKALTAILTSR